VLALAWKWTVQVYDTNSVENFEFFQIDTPIVPQMLQNHHLQFFVAWVSSIIAGHFFRGNHIPSPGQFPFFFLALLRAFETSTSR
jgi:hypothetical protein